MCDFFTVDPDRNAMVNDCLLLDELLQRLKGNLLATWKINRLVKAHVVLNYSDFQRYLSDFEPEKSDKLKGLNKDSLPEGSTDNDKTFHSQIAWVWVFYPKDNNAGFMMVLQHIYILVT